MRLVGGVLFITALQKIIKHQTQSPFSTLPHPIPPNRSPGSSDTITPRRTRTNIVIQISENIRTLEAGEEQTDKETGRLPKKNAEVRTSERGNPA